MALTKVTGHVIKSDTNITSHNINSSGIITAISFDGNVSGVAVTFTGDGSTTEFTLSHTPANNESLMVTINGVLQHPSNTSTVVPLTANVLPVPIKLS